MNKILDSAILLRKKLIVNTSDITHLNGNINKLESIDIDSIKILEENNLIEIFDSFDIQIYGEDLHSHIGEKLTFEIKVGDIPNYYELFEDFIEGNKIKCRHVDFFIADIDYRENIDHSFQIVDYKNNLKLIDFLKKLADNEKLVGNRLEVFFFKSFKGSSLKIEYDINSLKEVNLSDEFIKQILDANYNDKKLLFTNELINFLEKNGDSYTKLVEGWNILKENYNKSYSLFLSGFSFDKIKTSSNEHFQKLVDRIYESIGKASNYIFGVPIGFILLINNFDFSGILIAKNLVLLILGTIFFIMIRNVLFSNIKESIASIVIDIEDFISKIEHNNDLEEIKIKLNSLKNFEIKKQLDKLKLVRVLTSIIYTIVLIIYIFIFIDVSVYYL